MLILHLCNNQTDNSEVKNYVHNNLNTNPATKPTTSIPEERGLDMLHILL